MKREEGRGKSEVVVLEGAYVRLEPLSVGHLDGLCPVGLDERLWKWTTSQVRTRDDMRRYVETALEWQRAGTALPFANVWRSENRVIGSTRFANIDRANRRVEIGWTWIGLPWQRTAANTEAKYLMLRHAFEVLHCIRVEFKTDALNAVSRRAISRIGAREEGTLRSHMIAESGRVRDTVYFSIIESEWPRVKADLERRLAR
ncbi:MAG: GNAT family N-acetyltransferase [Gemmatimonadetes bacterium]|nr:GNAT family N-acetyltransferase [Gemmatimonadota bacterium]